MEAEAIVEPAGATAGDRELGDPALLTGGLDRAHQKRSVVAAARLLVDDDLLQWADGPLVASSGTIVVSA